MIPAGQPGSNSGADAPENRVPNQAPALHKRKRVGDHLNRLRMGNLPALNPVRPFAPNVTLAQIASSQRGKAAGILLKPDGSLANKQGLINNLKALPGQNARFKKAIIKLQRPETTQVDLAKFYVLSTQVASQVLAAQKQLTNLQTAVQQNSAQHQEIMQVKEQAEALSQIVSSNFLDDRQQLSDQQLNRQRQLVLQMARQRNIAMANLQRILIDHLMNQQAQRRVTNAQRYKIMSGRLQDMHQAFPDNRDAMLNNWLGGDGRGRIVEDRYRDLPAPRKKFKKDFGWGGNQTKWQIGDRNIRLLPTQAPSLNRTILKQNTMKLQDIGAVNKLFRDSLQNDMKKAKNNINQMRLNKKYWSFNEAPKGFQWNNDRQQLVFMPQNPHVKQLFKKGIGYKQIGSVKKMNQQMKFLDNTHISAQQAREQMDQDLVDIVDAAQLIGFNPHFGKISKNSNSLFVGAFVDPLTGNIRLPPKPSMSDFNPVDRASMAQYKILKAMYMWNASIQAVQQMKKFMNMSDKQWSNKVKNSRKAANVAQRKRNQLKNIARKIAFKRDIYGQKPSSQTYKALASVWQNKNANIQQLSQSLRAFMQNVSIENHNALQAQIRSNQVPKMSNLARLNAAQKFKDRPVTDAQKWLKRTTIKPVPLNKTGTYISQIDSLGVKAGQITRNKASNLNINNAQKLAFNSLQDLRNAPAYADFGLQNDAHVTMNPAWSGQYYKGIQPTDNIASNRKFWKNMQGKIRPFTDDSPYDSSKLSDKLREYGQQQYALRMQNFEDLIDIIISQNKDIEGLGQLQKWATKAQLKKTLLGFLTSVQSSWKTNAGIPALRSALTTLGITDIPPSNVLRAWTDTTTPRNDFKSSTFYGQLARWLVLERNRLLYKATRAATNQGVNQLLRQQQNAYLLLGDSNRQALLKKLRDNGVNLSGRQTTSYLQNLLLTMPNVK